jgi:hypothetical protein
LGDESADVPSVPADDSESVLSMMARARSSELPRRRPPDATDWVRCGDRRGGGAASAGLEPGEKDTDMERAAEAPAAGEEKGVGVDAGGVDAAACRLLLGKVREAPVEEAPVEEAPVEEAPAEEAPVEEGMAREGDLPEADLLGEREEAADTPWKDVPLTLMWRVGLGAGRHASAAWSAFLLPHSLQGMPAQGTPGFEASTPPPGGAMWARGAGGGLERNADVGCSGREVVRGRWWGFAVRGGGGGVKNWNFG